MRKINFFVEDAYHREFLGALVQRLAAFYKVQVEMNFVSTHGGHGRVLYELRQHMLDLQRNKKSSSDLFIVATDGNCKGYAGRKQEVDKVVKDFSGSLVYAIPDPHIERWLLLDSSAFKTVLGKGCSAPIQKCQRDLYKRLLGDAIHDAIGGSTFSGIEYIADLVNAMNLDYLERAEESLGRLLKELRRIFQEWHRSEYGSSQKLQESAILYIIETEIDSLQT